MSPSFRSVDRSQLEQGLPSPAPLVSVVLASRNGERFLEAALAGLAAQTYPRLEILAVDDGSTDRTGPVLDVFAASRSDTRVLRTPGLGAAGARALAFEAAAGEFFALQDDDDLSHPERIAREVSVLLAHPDLAAVGTGAEIIDERGHRVASYPVPTRSRAIRRMLRRAPPFVHGSVMMRSDAYRAAGGYRAAFRAAEDYDLYLRFPPGASLANLDETLYSWRLHPGNSFSRSRGDHLFFLAVARAFDDERRTTGRDSIALLERAADREAFLAQYDHAGRLLSYWGEALTREGRVREARERLARAWSRGRSRVHSLAWYVLSLGMALTPRARRGPASSGAAPAASMR